MPYLVANGTAPLAICTGHEFQVVCVDVNTSLGIVASGSLGKSHCMISRIEISSFSSEDGVAIQIVRYLWYAPV